MTPMAINRARNVWTDTLEIVSATDARVAQFARPIPIDQLDPAIQLPAEEEADRWVEQQLFDHYNG